MRADIFNWALGDGVPNEDKATGEKIRDSLQRTKGRPWTIMWDQIYGMGASLRRWPWPRCGSRLRLVVLSAIAADLVCTGAGQP